MTSIKEVTTFSKIPSFVPLGVLYFTQDTADLYIGTGSSNGPAVTFIGGGGASLPLLSSDGSTPVSFANECSSLIEAAQTGGAQTAVPIVQSMDNAGVVHDVMCRVTSSDGAPISTGTIVFPYPVSFGQGIPAGLAPGLLEITRTATAGAGLILTNASGTGSRQNSINFRGCNGPGFGVACGTDLSFVEDPNGTGAEEYLWKLIGGNFPLYFGNSIGTAALPGIALGGANAMTGPVLYIKRNLGGNDHIGRTTVSNGNPDTWNVKTLSGGTGTVTFSPAWTSAPVCWCNNPNQSGSPIACSASATNTTLTLKSGAGTDTVNYLCLGNPI